MINILRKLQTLILHAIDRFYFPFLRFIPIRIFRYGVTGGMNTLFDLLLYFLVYNYVLHKQLVTLPFIAISAHIAAFMLVFPVTFTTGFLLARYITFTASELRGRVQLFRYGLTVAGSILLNYVFLKLFVEYFGLYATLSKAITTVIVVIYSYVLQRYFSFRIENVAVEQKIA